MRLLALLIDKCSYYKVWRWFWWHILLQKSVSYIATAKGYFSLKNVGFDSSKIIFVPQNTLLRRWYYNNYAIVYFIRWKEFGNSAQFSHKLESVLPHLFRDIVTNQPHFESSIFKIVFTQSASWELKRETSKCFAVCHVYGSYAFVY